MNTTAIHRAALVVASLDRRSADSVLERIPSDQALAIREAMVLLHEDDKHERQQAIHELLSVTQRRAASTQDQEICTLTESTREAQVAPIPGPHTSSLTELLSHNNQAIAVALRCERTSVVASMLAAIPKERAAGVLRLLPMPMRSEVIAALNVGVRRNTKAIDTIADLICDTEASEALDQRVGLQHRDALQAIFAELSSEEQLEMLRDIQKENPMLAQRLVQGKSAQPRDCSCEA